MSLSDVLTTGLAWKDGQLIDQLVTPDEIAERTHDPDCVVWLDLTNPTKEVLHELAAKLDLAPTTIEDALAPFERPKVTRHRDHIFFTAYSATIDAQPSDPNAGLIRLARVSGIVLRNVLITVRPHDAFDMQPVIARWTDAGDLTRDGVLALVHGLLDDIVDGHFEAIQNLDDEVEQIEEDLFAEHLDPRFLRRIYGFRKDLVTLRRVVLPMREVVNSILRHRGYTHTDLDHWFDDLYDHVLRASEWTESLRDMLSTLFDTHLSLQDARLNMVMKKLAAWAAIIAVPTAITGWFGQNVPYFGFDQPWGVWLSLGSIVACSVVLYVLFRRRDWL